MPHKAVALPQVRSHNFHMYRFNDIWQYVCCAAAVDGFNLASVDVYVPTAIHPAFKTQKYSPCITALCHWTSSICQYALQLWLHVLIQQWWFSETSPTNLSWYWRLRCVFYNLPT